MDRLVDRIVTTPAPEPGFAGPGHTAVEVLGSSALHETDPFVLLMDDRLDFPPGRQVGGAHPHAGLETVTLVLEGTIRDRDEGELSAGDVAWMTAGRGVIHNEEVEATGRVRILQLWIALPERERTAAPAIEVLRADAVPLRREGGASARVYPSRGRVPAQVIDVRLDRGASIAQEIPASYGGFFYVLEGDVTAGGNEARLRAGQVGWLDPREGEGTTSLRVSSSGGGRVILYVGERQRERFVHQGPFVAGSTDELARYFRAFRAGSFTRLSAITRARDVASGV